MSKYRIRSSHSDGYYDDSSGVPRNDPNDLNPNPSHHSNSSGQEPVQSGAGGSTTVPPSSSTPPPSQQTPTPTPSLVGATTNQVRGMYDSFAASGVEPNLEDFLRATHMGSGILEHIMYSLRYLFGWFIWEYIDLFGQFKLWASYDYSAYRLIFDTSLLWRGMVVGFLTAAIIELAPLEIYIGELVGDFFVLLGDLASSFSALGHDITETIVRIVHKITGVVTSVGRTYERRILK